MDSKHTKAREALMQSQAELKEWADNQVANYNRRFEEKLREFIRTSDDLTPEGYARFLAATL